MPIRLRAGIQVWMQVRSERCKPESNSRLPMVWYNKLLPKQGLPNRWSIQKTVQNCWTWLSGMQRTMGLKKPRIPDGRPLRYSNWNSSSWISSVLVQPQMWPCQPMNPDPCQLLTERTRAEQQFHPKSRVPTLFRYRVPQDRIAAWKHRPLLYTQTIDCQE